MALQYNCSDRALIWPHYDITFFQSGYSSRFFSFCKKNEFSKHSSAIPMEWVVFASVFSGLIAIGTLIVAVWIFLKCYKQKMSGRTAVRQLEGSATTIVERAHKGGAEAENSVKTLKSSKEHRVDLPTLHEVNEERSNSTGHRSYRNASLPGSVPVGKSSRQEEGKDMKQCKGASLPNFPVSQDSRPPADDSDLNRSQRSVSITATCKDSRRLSSTLLAEHQLMDVGKPPRDCQAELEESEKVKKSWHRWDPSI